MQPVLVFSTPQFSRSFKNMLEFKLFQKIFFQEAKFSLVCDWLSWSEKILKILTIYTLLSHPWLRAIGEDSPSSQNVFFGNSISPMYCHRLFWRFNLLHYFRLLCAWSRIGAQLHHMEKRNVTCWMFMRLKCIFYCWRYNVKYLVIWGILEFYICRHFALRRSFYGD